MKRKIIGVLLGIIGIFSGSIALAAEWTGDGVIEGVFVDTRAGSERVIFRHTDMKNPAECTAPSAATYYELKSDSSMSEKAYALLLSSHVAKSNIKVYLDGCGSTNLPLAVMVDTSL